MAAAVAALLLLLLLALLLLLLLMLLLFAVEVAHAVVVGVAVLVPSVPPIVAVVAMVAATAAVVLAPAAAFIENVLELFLLFGHQESARLPPRLCPRDEAARGPPERRQLNCRHTVEDIRVTCTQADSSAAAPITKA